jgi:hypothetical protein
MTSVLSLFLATIFVGIATGQFLFDRICQEQYDVKQNFDAKAVNKSKINQFSDYSHEFKLFSTSENGTRSSATTSLSKRMQTVSQQCMKNVTPPQSRL